ncbi:MAG: glycosyltransferase family 9 protein [Patescibacteria group bacterium]
MIGRKIINKSDAGFFVEIKARLIGFCYDVSNFLLRIFSYVFWPGRLKKSPKKICIYRIGNIGDIICAIPAMIAVRKSYPDSRITLLTSPGHKSRPGAEQLLKEAWFIDELKVYYSEDIKGLKNIFNFIRKLRAESFDLWIYFPQELITFTPLIRNLFFTKFCGVKKAVGFEISTIKFWAREQSKIYEFDNETDRLTGLLKRWGVLTGDEVRYDLPIPKNVQDSALRIVNDCKIKADFLFGIMPGASYEDNQWLPDNFAEVGKFILRQYKNCQIIIFGGPDDKDKGEYIKDKIGGNRVINLCGKASLLETAFVINKLTLLVSNNTGLMHMAALAGIKVIAIFSPAELNGKWFPYGENSRVVIKREAPECDGYYYKNYYKKTFNCHKRINDVSAEEVKNEIKKSQ